MNITKILENMPDEVVPMHQYIFKEFAGMFSTCHLKKFEVKPNMKLYVDKDGMYKKCTIIEYPNLYALFTMCGIEEKLLSFGHDGIDEFFCKCYCDIEDISMKRPDLHQKVKKYMASIQHMNEKDLGYYLLGDLGNIMNERFFDKIKQLVEEDQKSTAPAIIVFDTDTLIINRRVPAFEAKIQVKIDVSQTVCQADVEISKKKYRNKGYKILQGTEVVE